MPDGTGGDSPAIGAVLDLIPASRDEAFISWMDAVDGEDLVVSIPYDLARRPVTLAAGEQIELIWNASGALRSLPVVLAGIDLGEPPRWRLRRTGVVHRGQRREAVRAPLRAPVTLGAEGSAASGTTVDLSEGGLRCILDRERRPPATGSAPDAQALFRTGDVVRVSVTLPELTVTCLSEISRRHPRDDGRTEVSLRFIGMPEHVQDDLRRRVFARLRDLRQRGLL
ncbi:MAG: flagellar brake protein [Nocardioidaceae bacterium]